MRRGSRFNWLAPVYDWGMLPAEWALRPFRRDLQRLASGRILDIGVGTGATLPHYPQGRCIIGIDTSAAMLRRATQKADQLGLRYTPIRMDTHRLAFPDGSFDTVVCSLVMCSVADPHLALCEVRRVLRPGGQALFIEHVRPSGILGYVFDVANIVWSPLVCQLTRRTEALVKWAGFDLLHSQAPVDFLRVMVASPNTDHDPCASRPPTP